MAQLQNVTITIIPGHDERWNDLFLVLPHPVTYLHGLPPGIYGKVTFSDRGQNARHIV